MYYQVVQWTHKTNKQQERRGESACVRILESMAVFCWFQPGQKMKSEENTGVFRGGNGTQPSLVSSQIVSVKIHSLPKSSRIEKDRSLPKGKPDEEVEFGTNVLKVKEEAKSDLLKIGFLRRYVVFTMTVPSSTHDEAICASQHDGSGREQEGTVVVS
ncbi:hypothetical protein AKJ16_DCAP10360 [Drosera capensis]